MNKTTLSIAVMFFSTALYAANASYPTYPISNRPAATRPAGNPYLNPGRTLADIEVWLQAGAMYEKGEPVEVMVGVTNLFDKKQYLNGRLLPNTLRGEGEIAFQVIAPSGKELNFLSIVTPRSVQKDDFVLLSRGQTIHRTLNLADMYDLKEKGTYRVRVLYRNNTYMRTTDLQSWMGEIVSEPASFDIK